MSKRWAPPKDRSIEFQTRYVTDTLSDARLANGASTDPPGITFIKGAEIEAWVVSEVIRMGGAA